MADHRLLAGIRRYWSRERCDSVYKQIFEANLARLEDVTVIIGKSTGEDSASGQVVVSREDYLMWMEALEIRLKELEAAEAGESPVTEGTQHLEFNHRYVRT